MKITLRLFSSLREMTGVSEYVLETREAISCEEAAAQFAALHSGSVHLLKQCALARNGNFTGREAMLSHGDELAILPPSSGG